MNLFFLLFLQLTGLLAIAMAYHKVSGAIAAQRKEAIALADNMFNQIESLNSIYVELGFHHALPPTRGWAASPDFLRNIMTTALTQKPLTIVECSSGVSTIVLARCMEILGAGHVYSLEHDEAFAEQTRTLLRKYGLERFATVCNAPLKEISLPGWSGKWYSLEGLPESIELDFLVIDGPPQSVAEMARYPAVPCLRKIFSDQVTILLDDADRKDEGIAVRRWLDESPDLSLIRVPRCEKGCVALKREARIPVRAL